MARWRDGSGRQRGKRFAGEEAARAFDEALAEIAPVERRADGAKEAGGVYSYPTKRGLRWYLKFRGSDGVQTSRRGFTSARSARDAKRRLTERIERGEVRQTRESFREYWQRWLARRKPYLEPGTWQGYEINGRLRLLPALGDVPLGRLAVEDMRAWMEGQAEGVEAGEVAVKTVNDALGTLVVCLNAAVEDGLIAANPALRVPRLPAARIGREYLRLHEISGYLDCCSAVYRPAAELLIGGGLRISEALAPRVGDLELESTGGVIVVYRSRKRGEAVGSTKSDRFRAVEIGPALSEVLRHHLARRGEASAGEQVRQVARTLGVHENTVRRWEERGLLHAVRLPSGVRCFRPDDVEAVRAQMFSGFAPLHADDDVVSVPASSID